MYREWLKDTADITTQLHNKPPTSPASPGGGPTGGKLQKLMGPNGPGLLQPLQGAPLLPGQQYLCRELCEVFEACAEAAAGGNWGGEQDRGRGKEERQAWRACLHYVGHMMFKYVI